VSGPRSATAGPHGRYYERNGKRFDSVTSALSAGVPKPALVSWAAREAAIYAVDNAETLAVLGRDAAIAAAKSAPWSVRDRAAQRGSDLHAYAEAAAIDKPMPEPSEELAPLVAAVQQWVSDYGVTYVMAEGTVAHDGLGYAGTLDAVVNIDDELVLVDIKTGRAVYPETALQLCAYRRAEVVWLPDGSTAPVPQVSRTVVVHIRPAGYQVHAIRTGDAEWMAFRAALCVARWSWSSQADSPVSVPLPVRVAAP